MNKRDQELLDMLAEEAAEVIQAIMKIKRHGIESYHPDDPSTSNRDLLKDEMTDLKAVLLEVEEYIVGDINGRQMNETWMRKLKYTHHQEETK